MTKRTRLLPLLLAGSLLLGCTPGAAGDDVATQLAAPAEVKPLSMSSDGIYDVNPEAYSGGYAEALADFCRRAAQAALTQETENALFSPVSLYFAMAALAGAAEGETQAELLAALGMDEATLIEGTQKLYANLNIEDKMGRVHTANSLWLGNMFAPDAAALASLAEDYRLELWRADFQAEETAARIAQWVADKTGGKLGDKADFAFDSLTAMALYNAIEFEDEWMNRFDKSATAADTFHNADGSSSTCDFLNAHNASQSFNAYESEASGFLSSTLGLKHGSMTFVLPDEGVSPYDILQDDAAWNAALTGDGTGGGYGEVIWQIPKFDYTAELRLLDAMRALGVSAAFDPEAADFAPLRGSSEGPLYVSSARQKATVSVNEEGVSAAAYTEILLCGAALPMDSAEMVLDRPFLFIIEASGAVLFVGIVNQM